MNLKIIIQARTGSVRFPGKSMFKFNKRPVLALLIDSVSQIFSKKDIIVATSEKEGNESIRKLCLMEGIQCYCGSELNVASRFKNILDDEEMVKSDYFIRLNGDSPLFDYRLIDDELKGFNDGYDLISTIHQSRFPKGMNFEIISKNVFLTNYPKFTKDEYFEHVTKYFYENASSFKMKQVPIRVENPQDYNFAFDTKEDMYRLKKIFTNIRQPHYLFDFTEKCKIYDKLFKNV